MYDAKVVDWIQLHWLLVYHRLLKVYATYISADAIFPIIVMRRTRLRPYLSESAPILGETKNCSVLHSPEVSPSALIDMDRDIREYRAHKTTQKNDIPSM